MSLPEVVGKDRTDELRRTGRSPRRSRWLPGLRRLVRVGLTRAEPRLFPETRAQVDVAARRLDELERRMGSVGELPVRLQLVEQREASTAANTDALRREVQELREIADELGFAIAPGTGLGGAGSRLAELRERVNGLDRRLRRLAEEMTPPRPAAGAAAAAPPSQGGAAPRSALFDYVGFERRFRGDPEEVSETLWSRYGALLVGHGPVLDVGCGRGELLARLESQGVPAIGVDLDRVMVADAQARGLNVQLADGNDFLRAQPAGSLGAIIATQVVEHLELDAIVDFLELAAARLRSGGILIAETPNPASLIVLGNSYILDPTHVRPLHPSLLVFLCEGAGFRDVRLKFFAPAEGYHLPPVTAPDLPAWVQQINRSFARLNEVLFGPQDYAVVATTPS